MSPGTSIVALTVSRWLFLMYLPWKYKICFRWCRLSCTWCSPSIFSSTLPILWNVAFLTCITMEFHCVPQWCVLSFTCIFSRCCLQYALVLKVGIIFQVINWLLFFYIPEQKGPLLVVGVLKHTFTTTQNTKFLHILCTSDIYQLPLAAL